MARRSKKNGGKATSKAEIPTIAAKSNQLSDEFPDELKVAIASCVIAYSALEHTAERLIWDISGLSYDDGRLLTGSDSSKKFDVLRSMIERYGLVVHTRRQTTLDMWNALKELVPVRNLIVHGVWAMLDGKTPISVSHRLSSDAGEVVGESFRLERLSAFERQCYKIKKVFDGISERVAKSPAVRTGPHQPS